MSALRAWERDGLLSFEIKRDLFGRRVFASEDIERLRAFIRKRATDNAKSRSRQTR
jgi:DNA-binding transcriptional MerR regulator